ncbi:TetR/AcrR family transcriptional regulator [Marinivivus vitaminiproducens]|uniref:TetR/AcrR family transcriptional regulator n=1 Tax=Marinivivus vitaminiproducens TaxID=3035935 RepID=UPI0027A9F53A|nr:TetR/AcrR family transcriptional regulator [Geminicoccaceae bacterium SCSIO 64248]
MDGEGTTKGEQTRARLRRAATAVFARKGFHATKVSDIVAEAGVSQPTFYIHFDAKEAAYDSLVEEFRENLRRVTRSNLIDPATPSDRFVDRVALSFRRFLDFMAADRALTEIGFFQPPGCAVTKERLVAWVAANIAQEQSDGLFRRDVPARHIAHLLVGLLDQVGRLEADRDERERLAATCATLFCQGAGQG